MALLWFDGFESYDNMDDALILTNDIIASYYHNDSGAAYFPCSASYGRNGRGLQITSHPYYSRYTLVNTYTTFIVGFALNRHDAVVPTYSSGYPFFYFVESGTTQLAFYLVGTEIAVYMGTTNLLGTTSGAGLEYDAWRYIEIKFTIDNSSGSVEIHSDESTVLSLTSQDTQNTSNAFFDTINMRGGYNGVNLYYDDMYWCDTTGGKNDDFLGDVRIDVLRPNAAGTYTNFTPSAGSNYQNVDETYPDDNTTYNSGSSVGDKDTYNVSDLPSPSGTNIIGVKSQITARKTDAGSREAKILTIAGTTEDLGDAIALSSSFLTKTKIMDVNPDDSADWEDADVNALEVGIQITV